MHDANFWWVLMTCLIIAELFTGTFFLLMLALGALAGALAAYANAPMGWQQGMASLVGIAGMALLQLGRKRYRLSSPDNHHNPDMHLDIGQTVHVSQWSEEGTSQVLYRGAPWTARIESPAFSTLTPAPGAFIVVAVKGNTLLLQPKS